MSWALKMRGGWMQPRSMGGCEVCGGAVMGQGETTWVGFIGVGRPVVFPPGTGSGTSWGWN